MSVFLSHDMVVFTRLLGGVVTIDQSECRFIEDSSGVEDKDHSKPWCYPIVWIIRNGVFTWKLTVASLDSPRPEMKTNSFTNIWSSWPHSHYLCQDEWTMTCFFWPGPDCVSTLPVLFTLFWGGGGSYFREDSTLSVWWNHFLSI